MTNWVRPRRIQPDDQANGFDSGVHALDDYFARHSAKNDQIGIANCYVLLRPQSQSQWPVICGFYTLSMMSVEASDGEKITGQRLPKYPSPVALVGRLAVDRGVQRNGAGEFMLLDALERVTSSAVGSIGVITDAKNIAARAFYAKYGFQVLHTEIQQPEGTPSFPQRMFISRSTILAAQPPAATAQPIR